MRQPSTSAGAPVSLRVRRVDELVDARRRRRRRRRGRRASVRPCRRRAPASPSALSTTTNRHGREWCGAGARHAASTSASSSRAATGSGRNARIDRRASRNAGTACDVTGTGPRAAARTSSRYEPSRNHVASRPRTIATGTPDALPITSSAAAAISSAIATSVTCSIAAERVGRLAQVDDRRDPAHADRDVGEAAPPRPSERVGDDDRDVDAGAGAERVADVLGGAVGVDREQRGLAGVDVRQVDAGVRAHEAVPRLADDEVAAPAHDAHRLGLDEPVPAPRGRRGRASTSRPSAFDTIFCVTTRQSPSASGVPCAARGVERSSSAISSPGRISPMPVDRDDRAAARPRPSGDGGERVRGRARRRPRGCASSCRRRPRARRRPRPPARGRRRPRRSRACRRTRRTRGRRRRTTPRCRAGPSAGRPVPSPARRRRSG